MPADSIVQTFTFPLWACLIPAALAGALIGLGLWRRQNGRSGWLLLAAGAFVGVLFGPMLLLDRVVIDGETITQTTGFWWSPTVKGFRFADTQRVEIRIERVGNGRTAHNAEIWHIIDSRGSDRRVDPGDLWSSNSDAIVAVLRARGVNVR